MFKLDKSPRTTSNHIIKAQTDGRLQKLSSPYGADCFDCGSEVMCIRFTPDGSLFAAGLANGSIKVIDPETWECVYCLRDDDTIKAKLPVTALKFTPSHSSKVEHSHYLLATYASGLVKKWHYTSPSGTKALMTINEKRQTLCATYSPDGGRFTTAGADPVIKIYDAETSKKIRSMQPSDASSQMNGHRARVFALQYHPSQSNIMVSGGWDNTLQFWDDRQPHAFRKLYGPHICGDGMDIDIHQNHILTASWRKENTLQIWDFPTGEIIKNIPEDAMHESQLYCAQWYGKETIICGGCEANTVRVVDRATLNTIGRLNDLPGGVYCLDNDKKAKPTIAVGSSTKVWLVQLKNFEPKQ